MGKMTTPWLKKGRQKSNHQLQNATSKIKYKNKINENVSELSSYMNEQMIQRDLDKMSEKNDIAKKVSRKDKIIYCFKNLQLWVYLPLGSSKHIK